MPVPVGGDSWVDYIDQQLREAADLESRVNVIEQFRRAVSAEPGCIKVWMAYCEYFWSLHSDCQPGSDAGWTQDDQVIGRETFSLDAALNLWQEAYEAVRYRLSDSHELWNRWISLEMELLSKTRTEQGVRRITHLFKSRLAIPHTTWDNTSQMFSSFLSEYNRHAYESEMQQVTEHARDAKRRYQPRDPFETKLAAAARAGDLDEQKAVLSRYLDWEMKECKQHRDDVVAVEIALALYSRALTGIFSTDETTWINYIVFISSTQSDVKSGLVKNPNMAQIVPNMLDALQRAVHHIPWSGTAWARYILSGEQAGLSFSDMERIKHAATSSSQLDREGMSGVLEMYGAWCGYLKRTAMNPNASEEAVDLADIGLPAALEDVQHWGKRRYGEAYQGDPNYRLEKIYIQYLTEKQDRPEDARMLWERLSHNDLYANSYDFWLNYHLWEMLVFASAKSKGRSPTPSTVAQGLRVPTLATQVFIRALQRRTLDWPERIMDVYLQHCNDYEVTDTLRQALDTIHKTRRGVTRRREREAQAAYGAQAQAQAQPVSESTTTEANQESPSGKRKREGSPGEDGSGSNKRPRNDMVNGVEAAKGGQNQQALKRDRENTSVFISNLPVEATQTKVRQYFREYGHVNNIIFKKGDEGAMSLVEFRSPEEAQSALLRDGKYFGQQQITVKPATGCTLFVTNYPPEADEQYIRNLFKDCGEVFSVRFPSLKFNTQRRFCYVTFYDSESAASATKLSGRLLDGKFKLSAKYSDPQAKQQRSGALAEGRELHVLHLHPDAKEEELEAIFSKHGTVKSARILRNMAGQSHGTAFVVMETKEQAQEAISALDKRDYRNRILTVELSKPKNFKTTATVRGTPGASASPSPAPSGHDADGDGVIEDGAGDSGHRAHGRHSQTAADIAARTIAVLGIPDTVNDARVRAALAPLGEISKLVLRPTHGGAVVEFADVSTAGKATLAISGIEIEPGRKLRVGSVDELFQEKSETRVDRVDGKSTASAGRGKGPSDRGKGAGKASANSFMPPPPAVRRPTVLGAGGRRGGVGIPGPLKKGAGPDSDKTGVEATAKANGAAKSNADFKAMFLGSGGDKKRDQDDSTDS